jgi:hypothetical protein
VLRVHPGVRTSIRSLLNNLSTFEIVVVFVLGAAALAVAGVIAVERWYPGFREGSFDEGSKAIETTFTLLFGLILALTIAGLALNSDTANSAVSDEATAMAQLTRVGQGFNRQRRIPLKAAIEQYVHAVAEDEFATMKSGRQSPLAATALANLYAVYQNYNPGPGETKDYETSLAKIDELVALRRQRLQLSQQSLSPLLRIMLLIGTVVFVILSYPAKISNRVTRTTVVAAIAAFVTFVFVLTIVLDFPFSGDQSTSSKPYKEAVLAQYWPAI